MKKIFGIILMIPMTGCFYPLIYWFSHPELTQMQIFFATAHIYIPCLISGFIGYFIFNSDDNYV